ncbi:MAG: LysR substrate-binding domain-containing protein [Sandaracinaceae bacterium]
MDVDTLETFLRVMREGSFAAVARARGVAPSSVSRAIAGLEEELGVRLFHRDTRRLVPTDAGAAYHERLLPAVRQLRDAQAAATEQGDALRGPIRMTAPLTFAQLHLVPLLAAFAEEHPELELDLHLTDRLVGLVEERVDLAVRLGNLQDSALVATRLARMTYAVVASPAYLAARGEPRAPADLTEHACLRYPVRGHGPRWFLRGADGVTHEVPIQARVTLTNGIALRDCALRGLGVTLLPRWNLLPELASGALVEVLTDYEATASAFNLAAWLVLPSRERVPRRVRALVDYLRANLRIDATR